jgi:hypothetical protein
MFIRHMGGYLSAKYVLFSLIFIIQPNGNYSVKYYSAKYYSAKSNIIQPNEILFSQVGILFSQTAGWLASEGRCELAKSLHSEICWQARYYYILYVVCIGQIPATCRQGKADLRGFIRCTSTFCNVKSGPNCGGPLRRLWTPTYLLYPVLVPGRLLLDKILL